MNGNILLIRVKSIGDILFTLPAVHAIREAFPAARLTFLTFEQNAPLIEGFPGIHEIIPLNHAGYRSGNPVTIVTTTIALLRQLRAKRFSLSVDFQGYGETALLSWLSRAEQRWGNVYSTGRRWAYTRALQHKVHMHPVDWNLSMLHECGVTPTKVSNQFILPQSALTEARRLFQSLNLDPSRPTLFIQPFTSFTPRIWPLDRYLDVAKHWRSLNTQVLFCCGPENAPALSRVKPEFPAVAGAPILVAAGLMQLSTVILGGDTGLLHIATAQGKRVSMIMGAIHAGHAYPYGHPDWAVIPPPKQPFLAITADSVISATTRAFAENPSSNAT